jgi:hypothetical protein
LNFHPPIIYYRFWALQNICNIYWATSTPNLLLNASYYNG